MLPRCGTIEGRGRCISVFRCPECVVIVDLGGAPAELPLTVAVDETGRPVGPSH
jgi:hypothetical protein